LYIQALGGLALFLWGVQLLSSSLERSLGVTVKKLLYKITCTPWRGLLTGIVVTMLLQSSSLTSVTVVGLVNARVISLAQALAVIIGANVGTTVTGQLLSFELHQYALPVFVVGFGLSLLPVSTIRKIGSSLRSFGVLLLGFSFMVGAFAPFQEDKVSLVLSFQESNFTLMGMGFAWSALLQSSSAAMGAAMALLENGVILLPAAVALTIGADVGTSVTALIASIRTIGAARKTALGHFFFNLFSALLLLPFWNVFLYLARLTSLEETRQLANAHTLYNLLGALLFLPLIPLWVYLLDYLVDKKRIKKRSS